MGRYTAAVCRLCRRSGDKLMLKGSRCVTPKCAVDKRGKPPGQQVKQRRRVSDRGLQLREKQKDYKRAVENLHKAVRRGKMKNTTWVVVFLALGRIHFNLGEFDKAEAAFRNALLIYPRNAEVLTCLGALYGAANRLEEATTVLKSAIFYAPHYEKAYNDLLFVYIIRRDATAIRKILGKATAEGISLNPHLLQKSSLIIKSK